FLFSCSESPDSSRVSAENDSALKSTAQDSLPQVTLSPSNATRESMFTLTSERPILSGGKFQWYINGRIDESAKGFSFSSNKLIKGDVVRAVVIKNGKEFPSNEVTINNSPPIILDAGLVPRVPKAGSALQVDVKANDVDNDVISYKYEWALNGRFAGEESYLESDLKRGDEVTVAVTPYDGEDFGRPIHLKSNVKNSLPVFSENQPSFSGDTYEYHVKATDPDNDTLIYTLREKPDGMTIDSSSGIIKWKVGIENEGVYNITVSIRDDYGGELIVPFTSTISFAKKLP
ncbi:MAG: putative Ig domain-containing protein, partial [Candidatus Heimdallarchaeota archaeon]|nr:putative Ig domain-containing protein [Candidatus Heimdallarchaeota archaeon]